ncbi:alpha-galactosidase [Lacticaseibacillus paracasei]|nr:alpha-galactosidase [Lacticaseibacillus paracasei]
MKGAGLTAPLLISETRSPVQKPACKDLGRNGQSATITPKATYTPVSPGLARALETY